MNTQLLPLEKLLSEYATSRRDEFVNQHINYWDRYYGLLNNLRANVYPNINAGLASLSKSSSFYTDHGNSHFDEVVRYAGLLFNNNTLSTLKPYELYLLLCAIRIHDAGNIDGREDHEKRAYSILKEYGGIIHHDVAEHKLIADIAQAHGGEVMGTNSKDTISTLPERTEIGPIECRPRLIAALVRFADEICEHSARSAKHNIANDTLPTQSRLFQLYANSIQAAKPDTENKAFKLRYYIHTDWFKDKYPTPKNELKFFIEDVLDRIGKLNNERIYCNRFLPAEIRTERLEITLEYYKIVKSNGFEAQITCGTSNLTIPKQEEGYPDAPNDWRAELDISGETFSTRSWQ